MVVERERGTYGHGEEYLVSLEHTVKVFIHLPVLSLSVGSQHERNRPLHRE